MKCASVRIFNTRAGSPTVKQEFYVLSPFRIPFNPRRVKKNTYVHICTSNKETLKKGQHRIKKKLESNCGQTYLISTWNASSTGRKSRVPVQSVCIQSAEPRFGQRISTRCSDAMSSAFIGHWRASIPCKKSTSLSVLYMYFLYLLTWITGNKIWFTCKTCKSP